MAGYLAQVELTGAGAVGVKIAVATRDHDEAIRRLLRDNPTRGTISLSFEREPSFFHSLGLAGSRDVPIVAFLAGQLVCAGRCTVRQRYVGGGIRRVGYLGELRLDQSVAGRADLLRRGYAYFADQEAADPSDLHFTSIAADNLRARRLLERGLPGFPRYRPLADFVTLVIPVAPRSRVPRPPPDFAWEPAGAPDLPAACQFLNEQGAEHDLSCVWTEEILGGLGPHGLGLGDLWLVRRAGRIDACAALWDQRSFRQTVVRGYSQPLRFARPFLNLGAKVLGGVRLPPVGDTLRLAYLSPFAVSAPSRHQVVDCIQGLLGVAASRGIEHLAVGFDAADPAASLVSHALRPREYCSRLYQVTMPGTERAVPIGSGRRFAPELAFL
jgi:hypothetical protein